MKLKNLLEMSEQAVFRKIKSALEEEGFKPDEEDLKVMVEKSNKERIDPVLTAALVATESSFNPRARNTNRDGTGDYGYFQLNDRWHKQYRSNTEKHIETGIEHLRWCLSTENNNETKALARYNAGFPDSAAGKSYARKVLRFRRKLGRSVR